MNSLDERLRRLERLKRVQTSEEFDRTSLKPVPSVRTRDVDVKGIVNKSLSEANEKYVNTELQKIKLHFINGYQCETGSLCSLIDYSVRYIEANGLKIAKLLGVAFNSIFKLNTCVAFVQLFELSSGYDNGLLIDIINYAVSLLFQKLVDVVAEPEKPDNNKKKSLFKRK